MQLDDRRVGQGGQFVMHQLESLLQRVRGDASEPLPGLGLLRQHRIRMGRHLLGILLPSILPLVLKKFLNQKIQN